MVLFKMILLCAALGSLVTGADADCEACVDGWCHSRKTLIEGFHITDQLAIDHTNNILYVQLNSNINSAFFLDELRIKQVQVMNTSGMAVDQATHDLYVADYNRTVYRYKYGSNAAEVASYNTYETDMDLLFYKDKLYYTSRHCKGISYLKNTYFKFKVFDNVTITDFVVNKNNVIHYVADDQVWKLRNKIITLVAKKKYVLSTDKYGDVYLGDADENVVYKLNDSGELEAYAAYKTGAVDRFVFESANNIVFHDAADGTVATWKTGLTKCSLHPPHRKFSIDENCTPIITNEEQFQK